MTDLDTLDTLACDRCGGSLQIARLHDRHLAMISDLQRHKATIVCARCRAGLSGTGPTERDAIAAAVRRWQGRQAAPTPQEPA